MKVVNMNPFLINSMMLSWITMELDWPLVHQIDPSRYLMSLMINRH